MKPRAASSRLVFGVPEDPGEGKKHMALYARGDRTIRLVNPSLRLSCELEVLAEKCPEPLREGGEIQETRGSKPRSRRR